MDAGVKNDIEVTAPAANKSFHHLIDSLNAGPGFDLAHSQLVDEALAIWRRPGFETFVSLPTLRFEPFAHQLAAAERALRRSRARVILADEVGLGKTIEAGLVLSELRIRGLAARSLVITPAGLVEQWREELETKFAIPSEILANDKGPNASDSVTLVSLAAARRNPLASTLGQTSWDMVIVDEAHRLKNPKSASAKLVANLRSRFLLLLTATPVENDINELFQLVNLVSPGVLGSAGEFRKRHRISKSDTAKMTLQKGDNNELVRDVAALRSRLHEVMIRHRRSEVALMLPRRLAETVLVTPNADESKLYDCVSDRVRAEAKNNTSSARTLSLRSVQRLAGSSPVALQSILTKVGWHDLSEMSATVESTNKAKALQQLLSRHIAAGEKVIVFSAFRATVNYLKHTLQDAGIESVAYDGSLTRREKESVINDFRNDVPVLLTTEAAGEGRNMQFCHVLINYDLPWNPMQIEQRLGRVHRIGQEHDVLLINLVNKGSLEEQILRILEQKINLFELVIGELDMIIGRVDDDFDFESFVYKAHVDSANDQERNVRLDEMGDEIARARHSYVDTRERLDSLLPEDDQ